MNYIVKNCPAIYRTCNDCSNNSGKQCQNITDCVLKQIYEMCKDNALIGGIDETAEKVVNLLHIQEVE